VQSEMCALNVPLCPGQGRRRAFGLDRRASHQAHDALQTRHLTNLEPRRARSLWRSRISGAPQAQTTLRSLRKLDCVASAARDDESAGVCARAAPHRGPSQKLSGTSMSIVGDTGLAVFVLLFALPQPTRMSLAALAGLGQAGGRRH
jgi:hypothetical protein